MNDSLFDIEESHEPERVTPPLHWRTQAAEIARELLAKGGWSGAIIQSLERCAAMLDDDPYCLGWAQELRDAREREEALKPSKSR